MEFAQHADGFRAERRCRLVDDPADERERAVRLAEQRFAGHFGIFEIDLGGASAVHGRVIPPHHALRAAFHEEQAHARMLTLSAAGARRDDQVARERRIAHHRLVTRKRPAAARFFRGGRDVRRIEAPFGFGPRERCGRRPRDDALDQVGAARLAREAATDHHG